MDEWAGADRWRDNVKSENSIPTKHFNQYVFILYFISLCICFTIYLLEQQMMETLINLLFWSSPDPESAFLHTLFDLIITLCA